MPPVNEPTTTAPSPVWPVRLPDIKSQADLINFARGLLATPASSTPGDIQNANQIITATPVVTATTAVSAANIASQIGLTPVGTFSTISPELLLQLARLDHLNFFPPVGSPTNPSSSSCSEPSTSQQQKPNSLMQPGQSMAHCQTVEYQQTMQENPTAVMPMPRKYSMDTLQHHPIQQPPHPVYLQNHFMNASNEVFATMDRSQKQSSPPVFKLEFAAKNEPSSSSNSQPGTPAMSDRRAVPACAICGTDSTGIHFGVDACAACSAFFRRTVVLNKDYACNKGGRCTVVKDGSAGQKCRACRFRKCINAGMDKSSVQHRRDAIGKYSAGVKRELSPDGDYELPPKLSLISEASTSVAATPTGVNSYSTPSSIPRVPSTLRSQLHNNSFQLSNQKSILHELICRQSFLIEQRQLFYARCLGDWFRKPPTTENQTLHELTDFSNCMYHLWKIEPRLAADYMNRNRYLDPIPIVEKLKIYRNFVIMRQSVEEPYLTWKHGGLEKRWFVMPNNTYIDFNDPIKYFTNGALKDLKLDFETTTKLFLPSFTHAMDTIGETMKKIEITETELSILLGLVLLDPGVYGIQENTRNFLKGIRDQLIQDVYMYYEDELSHLYDPEIRMADLFMLVAAVKIHSIKTSENMHMMRVFELIPTDSCFNQMLDVESVNVSPENDEDQEAEQGPNPMSIPEAAREEKSPQVDDTPPVLQEHTDE